MQSEPLALPEQGETFVWPLPLAMTTRAPCRQVAWQLSPDEPIRLVREPDNPQDSRAIRVERLSGEIAGYLYALDIGFLSILFDKNLITSDESRVLSVRTGPGNLEQSDLSTDLKKVPSGRYPKVTIEVRLLVEPVWPLFTLIGIMGLKESNFTVHFNVAENPWLQPLAKLNLLYLAGHDQFHMPLSLVKAWIYLQDFPL